VETLRKRLEVVRGENQQLEDMLHEAEQRSSAEQASIAKLTADLTALQREQEGLVSAAAANAAAQDAHIGRLQAELESSSRQVAALQEQLQAVQEQHAQALSSKDSMEGGALEGEAQLWRHASQAGYLLQAATSTQVLAGFHAGWQAAMSVLSTQLCLTHVLCCCLVCPAALRAEVAMYESQLEAERRAHATTKAAAATRERNLEEQLGSSR
jgi:hypothetical protein